jgi:hypothetical protein
MEDVKADRANALRKVALFSGLSDVSFISCQGFKGDASEDHARNTP